MPRIMTTRCRLAWPGSREVAGHADQLVPTKAARHSHDVDDPNASITVVEMREPLDAGHPIARTPCPVCDGSLTTGPVALVLVGFTGDGSASTDLVTGAALPVHAKWISYFELSLEG